MTSYLHSLCLHTQAEHWKSHSEADGNPYKCLIISILKWALNTARQSPFLGFTLSLPHYNDWFILLVSSKPWHCPFPPTPTHTHICPHLLSFSRYSFSPCITEKLVPYMGTSSPSHFQRECLHLYASQPPSLVVKWRYHLFFHLFWPWILFPADFIEPSHCT